MSLTKDDIKQIGEIVVEVTSPMFEMVFARFDRLEGRMGNLESRMDSLENRVSGLENEFRDFKAETRSRLAVLEQKIDDLTASHSARFENVEDDIRLIYKLVNKLENGTKEEKLFAKQTVVKHLPAIYKAIVLVAREQKITLPDIK